MTVEPNDLPASRAEMQEAWADMTEGERIAFVSTCPREATLLIDCLIFDSVMRGSP